MIQYTIAVEGMACSMCKAHINDAVRLFPLPGMRWGRSGRSLGRRRGCVAGKELGHSVEERRLNFAGGISG